MTGCMSAMIYSRDWLSAGLLFHGHLKADRRDFAWCFSIFALVLEGTACTAFHTSSEAAVNRTPIRSKASLQPSAELLTCLRCLQLVQVVMTQHEDASRRGQDLKADSLAEVLVQKGHTVTVRTALGGGGGCECLRNLRHVFLSVRTQVQA